MKKLCTLLTVLVLLFAGTVLLATEVEAEQIMASGNCGDTISWKLTADGTLTISGSGAMPDYEAFGAPWNSYNENITSIVIESGITSIGHYAFWMSYATSVTIPATVKEVGNQAFHTVTTGKKLYIDDIVAWCNINFLDCTSNPLFANMFGGNGTLYLQGEPVTKLVIPGTVSKVSRYAFHGCTTIKEVIIQEGVEEIGRGAFGSSGVEKVTLPNSVTTIGTGAFSIAKNLVAINIPDSVSHLGDGVFDYCYSLKRITIPGSVKSVPFIFDECSLEYLEVLEGVESIELSSYKSYTKELKYLKLPLSIKSIKRGQAPEHLLYAGTENQWGCVQFYRDDEYEWIKVNQPSNYQVCYGEGAVEARESCTLVGDYCTSCNNWLAWEVKNVAEHTFGNGLPLDDSNHKFTCTDCGIEKTGTHIWNGGVVTKNATCKETGVKTYTCTGCGATKTETIAKLASHSYDSGKVTKETTCKEEGIKTYTCAVCGSTKTETIAKLTTHTPGPAATATTDQTCTVCGKVLAQATGETQPTTKPTEPAPTEKPTEPKPTEPKPTETKPTETKPTETKPTETKPTEIKPVESNPVESAPTEPITDSAPTEPATGPSAEPTDPSGTDVPTTPDATSPTEPGDTDEESGDATWIVVTVAAVVLLGGGGAAGWFFWKKKH